MKKYLIISLSIILICVIVGLLILEYSGFIYLGILTKTYSGKLGDNIFSFRHHQHLLLEDNGNNIIIKKSENNQHQHILTINFYKNKAQESDNVFEDIFKWYKDFSYNYLEDVEFGYVDWLDQKALKGKNNYINVAYQGIERDIFIGSIDYYGFSDDKAYIINISDGSKSIYPYGLEKEFSYIINTFKIK